MGALALRVVGDVDLLAVAVLGHDLGAELLRHRGQVLEGRRRLRGVLHAGDRDEVEDPERVRLPRIQVEPALLDPAQVEVDLRGHAHGEHPARLEVVEQLALHVEAGLAHRPLDVRPEQLRPERIERRQRRPGSGRRGTRSRGARRAAPGRSSSRSTRAAAPGAGCRSGRRSPRRRCSSRGWPAPPSRARGRAGCRGPRRPGPSGAARGSSAARRPTRARRPRESRRARRPVPRAAPAATTAYPPLST